MMVLNKLIVFLLSFVIISSGFQPIEYFVRKNLIQNNLRSSLIDEIPKEIYRTEFSGKGCVLLSAPGEFNHFLIRAAVFIYEHNERGTVGVILERPTAFTMGETSPNIGVFEANTLYMGGEDGSDTAIMLHQYKLSDQAKYIGAGIYLGGIREARELVTTYKAHPKDFKFFFNHVEWAPGIVEKEINEGRWEVVKVPPTLVIKQDDEATLWKKARFVIRQEKEDIDEDESDFVEVDAVPDTNNDMSAYDNNNTSD